MRFLRPWFRPMLIGLGSLALPAAVYCTTFNGLEADKSDAGAGATGGGTGGSTEGGTDVLQDQQDEAAVPAGYLSLDNAARACANVFRCPTLKTSILYSLGVPLDDLNYSNCLHWLAGPMPSSRVGFVLQAQVFQCIASAESCRDAGGCLWIEQLATGDDRCAGDAGPGDPTWSCTNDGGSVINCGNGSMVHCASGRYAPGVKCLVEDGGEGTCALEPTCTEATSCSGPVLTYCGMNGMKFSFNCAYSGYTCGFDFENYPCAPPVQDSGYCALTGKARCDGGSVWVCDGIFETQFDCASSSLECIDSDDNAYCMPLNPTCTQFDMDANDCSGATMHGCVGGRNVTIDCESLGMTCKPAAQGRSAHCG